MEREQCEQAIIEKLKEIWEIYHAYYPDGDYLAMHLTPDSMDLRNKYWIDEKQINKFIYKEDNGEWREWNSEN